MGEPKRRNHQTAQVRIKYEIKFYKLFNLDSTLWDSLSVIDATYEIFEIRINWDKRRREPGYV